jgi:hypothetical protein
MTEEIDRFEAEYEARLEAEADAALERIQRGQSWADWLKIGELFVHGRKLAMLRGHANKPEGKGYNLSFSAWMDAHPKLRVVDKATRNHAMQCFDNRDAIETWRASLGENQRQAKNHPTVVLRGWNKSNAENAGAEAVKKTSKAAETQEKLAEFERENIALRQRLEKSGENLFALSDTAKNIARVLAGNMSVPKLTELGKALAAELAAKRKLEADKKRAGPR